MSTSISYFRRLNNLEAIQQLMTISKQHPVASTNWRYSVQTPRVFWPQLRGFPWWEASTFQLYHLLKESFASKYDQIQTELDQVILLQTTNKLRDVLSPDLEEQRIREGETREEKEESEGFKQIFTPYIGVRSFGSAREIAWKEFGPLFTGSKWDESKCRYLPTLCKTIQGYIGNELCGMSGFTPSSNQSEDSVKRTVEDRCGSDTIVTLLKLTPGSHILPHCGTTNKRLIMHLVLRGMLYIHYYLYPTSLFLTFIVLIIIRRKRNTVSRR